MLTYKIINKFDFQYSKLNHEWWTRLGRLSSRTKSVEDIQEHPQSPRGNTCRVI